jgi:hypothetical protein
MLQPRKQLVATYVHALFEELCELSRMLLLYRLDGLYQNQLLMNPIPPPCTSVTKLYTTVIDHPDRKIIGPLDMYAGRLILDMELYELARAA